MSGTAELPVRARSELVTIYAVHAAFQRDLGRLARGEAGRPGWERLKRFLRTHQTAEDTCLWPILRARPVLVAAHERLEDERIALIGLVDAVDAAVLTGRGLAGEVDRLAAAMSAYGRHETDLVEAVALRPPERDQLAWEHRRLLGMRGAGRFYPWLLDGASARLREGVLAGLTPLDRLLYRAFWRRRYAHGLGGLAVGC
jgi:hypothetical protein